MARSAPSTCCSIHEDKRSAAEACSEGSYEPTRLASNHPATAVAATPARSNPPPLAVNPPRAAVQTNQAATNPFVISNLKPAPTPEPPKVPPPTPTNKLPEVEVTRVAEELVVKPPQEIAVINPPVLSPPPRTVEKSNVTPTSTNSAPLLVNKAEPKADKRSLISRLNPFGGKPKGKENVGTAPLLPQETSSNSAPIVVAAIPPNSSIPSALPSSPPVPVFPRYTYLSPSKPVAGNHSEAERFFAEGIKAQQGGRAAQAVTAYQKATQLDPAYFEAYYNRGLACYGLGNWKESLRDYEQALAIKPGSIDTRYNFALALQQANYPLDAAEELQEILNEKPGELRARLLLANLYAKQLNQPRQARQHYLKVLEGDPHHPKASEIRYWLAANP